MAFLLRELYFLNSGVLSISLQGQLLLLILGLKVNTNKNVLFLVNFDVIFFLLSRLCLVNWGLWWFHLYGFILFYFIKGKYGSCSHSFLLIVFVNVYLQQKKRSSFLGEICYLWFSLHNSFQGNSPLVLDSREEWAAQLWAQDLVFLAGMLGMSQTQAGCSKLRVWNRILCLTAEERRLTYSYMR